MGLVHIDNNVTFFYISLNLNKILYNIYAMPLQCLRDYYTSKRLNHRLPFKKRQLIYPFSNHKLSNLISTVRNGNIPLHIVILKRDISLVKFLLNVMIKLGMSINIPNDYNHTPLHLAILTNQHEIVQLLLENGG